MVFVFITCFSQRFWVLFSVNIPIKPIDVQKIPAGRAESYFLCDDVQTTWDGVLSCQQSGLIDP